MLCWYFFSANAIIYSAQKKAFDFSKNINLDVIVDEIHCGNNKKNRNKLIILSNGNRFETQMDVPSCQNIISNIKDNDDLNLELHLGQKNRVISIMNEVDILIDDKIYLNDMKTMYQILWVFTWGGFMVWMFNLYVRRDWGGLN